MSNKSNMFSPLVGLSTSCCKAFSSTIVRKTCVSQLLACLNDLTQSYDNSKPVDIVYLDFAKAFDTVAHQRLLFKLEFYGISGYIHSWLTSFLSHRRQRVILRNGASEWTPVTSGVPQGSILGPLLFLLFVNDLPKRGTIQSQVVLRAIQKRTETSNKEECEVLQTDLNKFSAWSYM